VKVVKVVFANRYFCPDYSATSQLLSDLAFFLAAEGREVYVFTSRQRYDQPNATLAPKETVQVVSLHRIRTSSLGQVSLVGRVVDYLTFYSSKELFLRTLVNPGDVIVAKTDLPLISIVAAAVGCPRRMRPAGGKCSKDLRIGISNAICVCRLGAPNQEN